MRWIVLILAVSITGCGMKEAKIATELEPITFEIGSESRPIEFSDIRYKLKRGSKVGEFHRLTIEKCSHRHDLYWVSKQKGSFSSDEIEEAFKQELENANYTITNNTEKIFGTKDDLMPELKIVGFVKNLQLQECYPRETYLLSGILDYNFIQGSAYLEIEWHVYDTMREMIALKFTTEGSFKIEKGIVGDNTDLITGAFTLAAHNIMANKEFHNIANKDYSIVEKQTTYSDTLHLNGSRLWKKSFKKQNYNINERVVTIQVGRSHGSGFAISDGYIITNSHVVGGNKRVKIITSTGLELLGHVLRRDAYRDVALVKIEQGYIESLPLQAKLPIVGSDVYAVGTPQYKELGNTLTKGVISNSNRVWKDKKRYIQADVSIYGGNSGGPLVNEYGNVVGISVAGILENGSGNSTNLNLFIPVTEALKALNIEVKK